MIVALESSGRYPVIAVGGHTRSEYMVGSSVDSHNEVIPELVVNCCARLGIVPDKVEGIVVGRGPGSFTGLRVGYGYAKGFALRLGIPLYESPTFHALATQVRGACAFLSDARREEFFCGVFVDGAPVRDAFLVSRVGLSAELERWENAIGSSLQLFVDHGVEVNTHALPIQDSWRAKGLLTLFRRGQPTPVTLAEAEPLYIRAVAAMTIEERLRGARGS
jgi:tRNA threonylcarbamoyl adenosine modification protein YeaZ